MSADELIAGILEIFSRPKLFGIASAGAVDFPFLPPRNKHELTKGGNAAKKKNE